VLDISFSPESAFDGFDYMDTGSVALIVNHLTFELSVGIVANCIGPLGDFNNCLRVSVCAGGSQHTNARRANNIFFIQEVLLF
jgi:hypothetical protein